MTFSRIPLRLAVLAALSILPIGGGALAQDRPGLFDNMFGRNNDQPPSRSPNDASELAVRIERLEGALRQLTGTVEQLQHQNQMLQMQVQQLSGRAPTPLPPAGAPTVGAPVVSPPAAPTGRRSDLFDPNANPTAPGAPRALGSDTRSVMAPAAPGPIVSDEAPIGPPNGRDAGAPLDLNSLAANPPPAAPVAAAPGAPMLQPGAAPPVRTIDPAGSRIATLPPSARPQDEYDMAYGYVLHKDYALAEQAFRDFLKKHPEERLAPDAQYWLGESMFQQQRYRDAAENFLAVSTKYERSGKAPDSLLRLGQSLAAMKQKEAACATLAEVGRKYPNAAASVKRSVANEQKRVHC